MSLPILHVFKYKTEILDINNKSSIDSFDCRKQEINRYLKEDALADMASGKGVTYLVVSETSNSIIAYYTLTSTSILYQKEIIIEDTKKLTTTGFPTVQIKMFAVSKGYQKTLYIDEEYGETLISDKILGSVIGDIYQIALERLGATMIFLHSSISFQDNTNNPKKRRLTEQTSTLGNTSVPLVLEAL